MQAASDILLGWIRDTGHRRADATSTSASCGTGRALRVDALARTAWPLWGVLRLDARAGGSHGRHDGCDRAARLTPDLLGRAAVMGHPVGRVVELVHGKVPAGVFTGPGGRPPRSHRRSPGGPE